MGYSSLPLCTLCIQWIPAFVLQVVRVFLLPSQHLLPLSISVRGSRSPDFSLPILTIPLYILLFPYLETLKNKMRLFREEWGEKQLVGC